MATTFYEKKNNAKTTITNDPLAAGGLSITLATGTGSLFPSSGTWLITIWDNDTYPNNPTADPNMEVCLIDSRSTDTLTVNSSGRGFAGTADVEHASGSAIAMLIMKEHFDELETAINTAEDDIDNLETGWIGARAKPATNQENLTNTVQTQVVLGTEVYDDGDNFANNEFTVPVGGAGKYKIKGKVSWKGSSIVANKTYVMRIYKNGSGGVKLLDNTQHAAYSAGDSTANVSCFEAGTFKLAEGDTIQLWARQDSGVNTVDIDASLTYLEVILDKLDS